NSLRQQISIAAVALFGTAETRVLPHGPRAAAVHIGINAARERKLSWGFGHDREMRRARMNEPMPNNSITSAKSPAAKAPNNASPSVSALRKFLHADQMAGIAISMNSNPMISF